MKREIKFRFWDEAKKKMGTHTWSLDDLAYEGFPAPYVDENGEHARDYKVIPMQFTGLTDNSGKDIYEGDVLAYKTFYYGNEKDRTKVVKWDKWTSDDFGQPECVGYFNLDGTEEVIGNIYENPELLES